MINVPRSGVFGENRRESVFRYIFVFLMFTSIIIPLITFLHISFKFIRLLPDTFSRIWHNSYRPSSSFSPFNWPPPSGRLFLFDYLSALNYDTLIKKKIPRKRTASRE